MQREKIARQIATRKICQIATRQNQVRILFLKLKLKMSSEQIPMPKDKANSSLFSDLHDHMDHSGLQVRLHDDLFGGLQGDLHDCMDHSGLQGGLQDGLNNILHSNLDDPMDHSGLQGGLHNPMDHSGLHDDNILPFPTRSWSGQVEPITVSKDLVKSLHAMSQRRTEHKPKSPRDWVLAALEALMTISLLKMFASINVVDESS